jgi:pheromone shutdown protein TraB
MPNKKEDDFLTTKTTNAERTTMVRSSMQPSTLSLLAVLSLISTTSSVHGLSMGKPASRSYVEVIEPETGCKVVLLGCLHGSESSAADVRELLSEKTDAVVLELCAARLADLRRDMETLTDDGAPLEDEGFDSRRYMTMVARTYEKRGFATASAAAVLGGVSGLQTALSDFQPGLEFLTAMKIVERDNCDLVLADRTVDETLRRMGKLPSVSSSMLQSLVKEGSWKNTLGRDATALSEAVFGDSSMDESHQVQMPKVLTRNRAAVEDLLRLSLPPLIFSTTLANLLTKVLLLLFPQEAGVDFWSLFGDVALTRQDEIRLLTDISIDLLAQLATLAVGYVVLALPAARVILTERDEYLTRGIQAACRLESEKNKSEPGRVVAVLGLLHVNGVAKQLLNNKR